MQSVLKVNYIDKLTASEWKVIHGVLEEERQAEKEVRIYGREAKG